MAVTYIPRRDDGFRKVTTALDLMMKYGNYNTRRAEELRRQKLYKQAAAQIGEERQTYQPGVQQGGPQGTTLGNILQGQPGKRIEDFSPAEFQRFMGITGPQTAGYQEELVSPIEGRLDSRRLPGGKPIGSRRPGGSGIKIGPTGYDEQLRPEQINAGAVNPAEAARRDALNRFGSRETQGENVTTSSATPILGDEFSQETQMNAMGMDKVIPTTPADEILGDARFKTAYREKEERKLEKFMTTGKGRNFSDARRKKVTKIWMDNITRGETKKWNLRKGEGKRLRQQGKVMRDTTPSREDMKRMLVGNQKRQAAGRQDINDVSLVKNVRGGDLGRYFQTGRWEDLRIGKTDQPHTAYTSKLFQAYNKEMKNAKTPYQHFMITERYKQIQVGIDEAHGASTARGDSVAHGRYDSNKYKSLIGKMRRGGTGTGRSQPEGLWDDRKKMWVYDAAKIKRIKKLKDYRSRFFTAGELKKSGSRLTAGRSERKDAVVEDDLYRTDETLDRAETVKKDIDTKLSVELPEEKKEREEIAQKNLEGSYLYQTVKKNLPKKKKYESAYN